MMQLWQTNLKLNHTQLFIQQDVQSTVLPINYFCSCCTAPCNLDQYSCLHLADKKIRLRNCENFSKPTFVRLKPLWVYSEACTKEFSGSYYQGSSCFSLSYHNQCNRCFNLSKLYLWPLMIHVCCFYQPGIYLLATEGTERNFQMLTDHKISQGDEPAGRANIRN